MNKRIKKLVSENIKKNERINLCGNYDYKIYSFDKVSSDVDYILKAHQRNVSTGNNLLKIQEKTQVSIVDGFFVKSYKKVSWPLVSYALRSWKGLLALSYAGFNVPKPVACVCLKDGKSVLITELLPSLPLDRLMLKDFFTLGFVERITICKHLGRIIGEMHSRGIFHADLKACNIHSDWKNFVFTDTDRVCMYKGIVPLSKRIRNLVQINNSIPKFVSTTDRLRFLKSYCNETNDDLKKIFFSVLRLSHKDHIVYMSDSGDRIESWN